MRVLKYLWLHFVVWATDWMPDIKPVPRLRGFLLRPAFKRCGRNLQVARSVTINFPNRVELGRDVCVATHCWLHGWGGIVVEDEVMLGPYVVVVSGDHTQVDGSYRYGPSRQAPIFLGRTETGRRMNRIFRRCVRGYSRCEMATDGSRKATSSPG